MCKPFLQEFPVIKKSTLVGGGRKRLGEGERGGDSRSFFRIVGGSSQIYSQIRGTTSTKRNALQKKEKEVGLAGGQQLDHSYNGEKKSETLEVEKGVELVVQI